MVIFWTQTTLFHKYFRIKDGKFEFSDKVKEDKIQMRILAYNNYNRTPHSKYLLIIYFWEYWYYNHVFVG